MTDTIEQSPLDVDQDQDPDQPIVGHCCRRCEEGKTGAPSCN